MLGYFLMARLKDRLNEANATFISQKNTYYLGDVLSFFPLEGAVKLRCESSSNATFGEKEVCEASHSSPLLKLKTEMKW